MSDDMLVVEDLVREFPAQAGSRSMVRAVDGVRFTVARGEAFGLVGESGSGKSTTARCILRLIEPTSGEIWLAGQNITHVRKRKLRQIRHTAQIVFQDPYSALNPRKRVEDIVAEGIAIHRPHTPRSEVRAEVLDLLDMVGLRSDHLDRRPNAFSGGERQRIGIARALAVKPQLLVCDEPVASLDVSIQAQILNLFQDLKQRLGLTILFIAHDLATVRHLCDRVAVMEQGHIREIGTRNEVYRSPTHPYTQALMQAVPEPDPSVERRKFAERRNRSEVMAT